MALPAWAWLTLGLLLAASELVATQFVLIWFGAAAVAVGVVAWLVPALDLVGQLVLFALLSAILLVPARRLRRRWRGAPRGAEINDRAAQQVGRIVPLKEPIAGGQGRIFIGDTLWHVEGPDLPAGVSVRVVSYEGTTLLVEPVHQPSG
jgi:membrane protein implicated in regulation of membrane protease activity